MTKEQILAPLIPGVSAIPGIPSLPGNPLQTTQDLIKGDFGRPGRLFNDLKGAFKRDVPKTPPLPPVLPPIEALPQPQRNSETAGAAEGAARRTRSGRRSTVFNVGGGSGVAALSPLRGSARSSLGG